MLHNYFFYQFFLPIFYQFSLVGKPGGGGKARQERELQIRFSIGGLFVRNSIQPKNGERFETLKLENPKIRKPQNFFNPQNVFEPRIGVKNLGLLKILGFKNVLGFSNTRVF